MWFHNLSTNNKTLVVFLISVLIAVPLMFLTAQFVGSELYQAVLTSALGWFAGGAIVGTYIKYRK